MFNKEQLEYQKEERLGAKEPPSPMTQRPSTIPPPPLPVAQAYFPIPSPLTEDENCVTKRFYVNVFEPTAQPLQNDIISIDYESDDDEPEQLELSNDQQTQVFYRNNKFEIDEDAVTKEIRIQRLANFSSKRAGNLAAMEIRTLPTEDLSSPEIKQQILTLKSKLSPLIEAYRIAKNTLFSFWTQYRLKRNRFASYIDNDPRHKIDSTRLRLSVNSYSEDLYNDIRGILRSASTLSNPAIKQDGFSISLSQPPQISVNAALLKRTDIYSLLIRGKASHPVAIKDIMVFADKKKILHLSNAIRANAGFMEFSADVPLENAVSDIVVVARHNETVLNSQSLTIKKS